MTYTQFQETKMCRDQWYYSPDSSKWDTMFSLGHYDVCIQYPNSLSEGR